MLETQNQTFPLSLSSSAKIDFQGCCMTSDRDPVAREVEIEIPA
jgi:hypothetical protein